MTTTLKDLARMCDLNVSSVSRALRDDPLISVKTRERVQEAAKRVGYQPNLAARTLVAGKSHTLWMLLNTVESRLDRGAALAASRHCRTNDYDLMLALYDNDPDTAARLINRLTQGLADGAILIPRGGMDFSSLRPLLDRQFPLVFIDQHVEGAPVPVVTTDNAAAAAELVRCCAEAGATRFVVLYDAANTVEQARQQGALRQLSALGLPYVLSSDGHRMDLHEGSLGSIAILASRQDQVDTALTANPELFLTRTVLAGCFDNWSISSIPAVTKAFVAIQDFDAMARLAVDRLLAIIGNHAPLAFAQLLVPRKEIAVTQNPCFSGCSGYLSTMSQKQFPIA